ncbi:TIR domain-containing protein [Idiomarina loihiensis]|uniref:toll/interleukin-1 receptor domain-containing protein n=1 Tax=Idiomarina loihiensis TaxID=135577 RepID=UPI00129CD6B2|nr:TIR domain-containing protein [Idiomarina loihiensis]MRJ44852.1 TIR domain-containing protein [Idiomarina loihiensis]UTW33194.1 TIR domain-containing protein [Idiomarina loihiensis]
MKNTDQNYEYDVCFSFAGEDRDYVEAVAGSARSKGIRVFYDMYEEIDLWGKDLYEHLDDVYKNSAKYCVLFASESYAKKLWTNHERKSAQERAFKENVEYILPAKFDSTSIPGIRDTVGYVDLSKKTPEQLSDMIAQKVGRIPKFEYLPPEPNLLFQEFECEDKDDKAEVYSLVLDFLRTAKRMSMDEREALFSVFIYGCPGELPENMHININLLARITGFSQSNLLRIFSDISCLQFESHLREDDENEERLGKKEMLVIQWNNFDGFFEDGNATVTINTICELVQQCYCEGHLIEALCNLDFSALSDVTAEDSCQH